MLFDNTSLKSQEKIFNLYNRIILPDIIITPTKLYSKFTNNRLDYIIYISNRVGELYRFNDLKHKIFDTYTNGAITIKVDHSNKLTVISQLKKY